MPPHGPQSCSLFLECLRCLSSKKVSSMTVLLSSLCYCFQMCYGSGWQLCFHVTQGPHFIRTKAFFCGTLNGLNNKHLSFFSSCFQSEIDNANGIHYGHCCNINLSIMIAQSKVASSKALSDYQGSVCIYGSVF